MILILCYKYSWCNLQKCNQWLLSAWYYTGNTSEEVMLIGTSEKILISKVPQIGYLAINAAFSKLNDDYILLYFQTSTCHRVVVVVTSVQCASHTWRTSACRALWWPVTVSSTGWQMQIFAREIPAPMEEEKCACAVCATVGGLHSEWMTMNDSLLWLLIEATC